MPNFYDRVLITGSAGILARAFARLLRARQIEPIALDRASLDITTKDVVPRVQEIHPSLVINCAAYTKVDHCEREMEAAMSANAVGPIRLAEACRGVAKLVHFSTDFVFDGAARRPYHEDDLTNPLSFYGQSKLAGENAIREFAWDHLIVRTAWLYGPGGACFPQTILNAARQGKPLTVVNDQIGAPTFTRDLADATLRLIDAGATGLFHVVNSGQTTWHDFAVAILDEFGVKADVTPISSEEWKKLRPHSATRPAYSVLDTSKYTQLTEHRMRDWRQALHDYRLAVSE